MVNMAWFPNSGLRSAYESFNVDATSQYSTATFRENPVFQAEFAFNIIILLALAIFISFISKAGPYQPAKKIVLVALILWASTDITYLAYQIIELADITPQGAIQIDLYLNAIFDRATSCMVIAVLYKLIHGLLCYYSQYSTVNRPYTVTKKAHWVMLGLLAALCVADVVMYIVAVNGGAKHDGKEDLRRRYDLFEGFRTIIYFLVSIEILVWAILASRKAGSSRFPSRSSTYSLVLAILSWCFWNLASAIIGIYYCILPNTPLDSIGLIRSLIEFVFCVGTFTGIFICVKSWQKLQDVSDDPLLETQEYSSHWVSSGARYATVPVREH